MYHVFHWLVKDSPPQKKKNKIKIKKIKRVTALIFEAESMTRNQILFFSYYDYGNSEHIILNSNYVKDEIISKADGETFFLRN